ncbi:MAG: response regulator [Myxococcota bacterium]
MRILVVDDSKAMRMIVRRTLRQAGLGPHDVTEATNGREALAAVRETPPDLVLADWNMPEMTGFELLVTLRAEGSEVPLGFITTEQGDDVREQAFQAGASFLIAKPFTPDAFAETIGPHWVDVRATG